MVHVPTSKSTDLTIQCIERKANLRTLAPLNGLQREVREQLTQSTMNLRAIPPSTDSLGQGKTPRAGADINMMRDGQTPQKKTERTLKD